MLGCCNAGKSVSAPVCAFNVHQPFMITLYWLVNPKLGTSFLFDQRDEVTALRSYGVTLSLTQSAGSEGTCLWVGATAPSLTVWGVTITVTSKGTR